MNRNDRSIIKFTIVGHALVHTFELSIPIFMTVWLLEFSVSAAALGVVVALGYGLFGVGALPAGVLVDRYESRSLITLCLLGMGVSFLLVGLAPSVVVLTLALCVWGIAASMYHPAGLSLISTGMTNPGRGFGYHGAGGNVGIAVGPLATALMLIVFDWRLVAMLLGAGGILAAVYGLRLEFDEYVRDEVATDGDGQSREEFSLRQFGRDVKLLFTVGFLLVIAIVTFNGLFYRGALTFMPELLNDFLEPMADTLPTLDGGDAENSIDLDFSQYLYAGLLMVGILGQYVGGILVDRIPSEWGLAVCLGLLGLISVVFVPAATAGLASLVLVAMMLGFVLFAVQPMTQATVAKYSPMEIRGLSYGFTYLAIFGVGALGAAISGFALSVADDSTLFLILAGIAAAGAALSLVLVVIRTDGLGFE